MEEYIKLNKESGSTTRINFNNGVPYISYRILDDIQSNSSIYDVANGLKERGFTILEGDEDELGETVEMKISTLEEI